MKQIIYFIGMLLTLVNVSSCMQDETIEFESDEQLKLESSSFICSGNKDCLPKVLISGVENLATINFTDDSFKKDHRYTFKITDPSGYVYLLKENFPANSTLSYRFPPSLTHETYNVSYSITCNDCIRCTDEGSIQINADGKIQSSSTLQCFKNYVSYTAHLETNSSITIETSSSLPYTDPEHYMGVDKIRIFLLNQEGKKEKIYHNATVEASSVQRLTVKNIPTIESGKRYQIEFYNDICKGNATHYLYLVYNTYMPGQTYLEHISLQENKEH